MGKLLDPLEINRRVLLAGVPLAPTLGSRSSAPLHQFDRWTAEAYQLAERAWALPEEPEGPREELFRQIWALEELIINTPSLDEPAIRAKFGFIRWIMKNGSMGELVALDHIGEFIQLRMTGPWEIYTPR